MHVCATIRARGYLTQVHVCVVCATAGLAHVSLCHNCGAVEGRPKQCIREVAHDSRTDTRNRGPSLLSDTCRVGGLKCVGVCSLPVQVVSLIVRCCLAVVCRASSQWKLHVLLLQKAACLNRLGHGVVRHCWYNGRKLSQHVQHHLSVG